MMPEVFEHGGKDHGGGAKALWFLFILFLPLFGVCVYFLARPADVEGR